MPALESGVKAPEINLPLLKSKELFSLGRALKQGPVLASDTTPQQFRHEFLNYVAQRLAWYFTAHPTESEYDGYNK